MGKDKRRGRRAPRASHWLFSRRPPAVLDPIRRLFEPPTERVRPYVKNGQVAADLGCGSGYYTFALADLVGPEGKVYAADLGEACIRGLRRKAERAGYSNIETRASSAADVRFIKNRSVDFVFANGLL